jgi:DNA-binding PucR family transcriptional regulator
MDPHESVRRVADAIPEQFAHAGSLAMERLAEELPELTKDTRAYPILERAAHENAVALREHLRGSHAGERPRVALATRSLAREAVHWGVPVETLIECYQVAHDAVWAWWTDQLEREIVDRSDRIAAMRVSSTLMFAYVTALLRLTVEAHAAEREIWLQGRTLRHRQTVEAILERVELDPTAASQRLGYDLSLWHVGMILWLDEVIGTEQDQTQLDHTARAAASALGVSRPLLIPIDGLTLWAWLAHLTCPTADTPWPSLPDGSIRVAIGQPAKGISGFRASHDEAAAAQALATRAHVTSPIVRHSDVETLTLIDDHPDRLSRFVARQLRQLASDDDHAARLRGSVRAYLHAGSANVAAAQTHLHRNTMNRRLKAAEQLRGRPLNDDALGMALALELVEMYPAALLTDTSSRAQRTSGQRTAGTSTIPASPSAPLSSSATGAVRASAGEGDLSG